MSDPLKDLVATASQTVGPFFHFGLTEDTVLGQMAGAGAAGERIRLAIHVTDGERAPVPDAMVELWQSDHAGAYPDPFRDGRGPRPPFVHYGRLPTGDDGWCEFETIRPGVVADGSGQAAHINVCLFARGLLRQIHTRVYFAGDPALASDPVLRKLPTDRRSTLVAQAGTRTPGRWACGTA